MTSLKISSEYIYLRNPEAIHLRKNDKLYIFFSEQNESELIALEGFAGDFFLACDGTTPANEIAKKIGKDVSPDRAEDFIHMLTFLIECGFILRV